MPFRPTWLLGLVLFAGLLRVEAPSAAEAPKRKAEAVKYQAGQSYFVGGTWFQYLGENADGAGRWLYPHLDGVFEVFTETRDAAGPKAGKLYWTGDLESRFNPETGAFANLWGPAEAINEVLGAETNEQRRAAARMLALYMEIRGGEPPYYLREHTATIEKFLTKEDVAWAKAQSAEHAAAVKNVAKPGTVVQGLTAPVPLAQGPREYYRRMAEDGYLDICIVGGNMYDDERGTFNSWAFVEELRKKLDALGLKHYACRGSEDRSVSMKAVKLLGQNVTLRIRHTGGSSQYHRIVRGVTNFVEGLAHADVFIYHGHSNLLSGTYYISESIMDFSRFHIGLDNQKDLGAKCYGLKQKPYQLIAFQSCTSYEKYCRPVRWYYEKDLAKEPGNAGFMGNAAYCYFVDFAPRYGAMIEMLLQEKGTRDIAARLDGIRPDPRTPNMIFRGILQPRFTFIVPKGAKIEKFEEFHNDKFNLVEGTGSDGKTYDSTELFPQNKPGEVVQVARQLDGIYALYADGKLMKAGPGTDGAAKPSDLSADAARRFVFISQGTDGKTNPLLILVGKDGKIYLRHKDAQAGLAPCQPPQGTSFVAAGDDADGRLVAQDRDGKWHAWDEKARAFKPLDKPAELKDATPSLLGHGTPGALWSPEPLGK